MYELINCKETFIYSEPNYRDYCAGTYRVFYTYMKRLGQTVKDISVDKTAPIVPGEPIRNPEVPDHPVREYGSATVGAPLRGTAPAESYGDCC
jgi:hypothetical protein